MSDSSNPAADEIVSLTAAYQTAVVVLEDDHEDILLVRGGPCGHRRRPAVRRLPSVRLREGDDPIVAAARGYQDLTGHRPPRPPPSAATVTPVPEALWTSIHAFRAQHQDLVDHVTLLVLTHLLDYL